MDAIVSIPAGEAPIQWISPAWLADHHADELLIFDCQPNIHEYINGHIPGAVYLNENIFRAHEGTYPSRWINREAAMWLLRQVGLRADVPVVVYTGSGTLTGCTSYIGDGLEQTMVAYSLLRFGHGDVRILDGGLDAWRQEGRSVTSAYGTANESEYEPRVRNTLFIDYDEFLDLKDRDDVIVLDARPAATYQGQGPWPKPGHIPGAVNLPWKGLMSEKNTRQLRSPAEIRAAAEAVGATPEKTIVCTCGTGREATNEFLTFRYLLGYPKVRLFEGSFTEWLNYPANPTLTGPNPR
ncbi:MAG TPA: sulfurtransferase [Methanoregulaceae archaeon]|nr:sulfurtransferase [Methanoregulaceae archaeon]